MAALTQEKRNNILGVALGTILLLGALWYGLIRTQQRSLEAKAKLIDEVKTQVANAHRLSANAARYEADFKQASERLSVLEASMASGDMYSWIIRTMNRFQAPYKVEIPNFTPPAIGEVPLFPKFPYQSATFSIRGTGHFNEFGRFLADLENTFPCMRVQNLDIEPLGTLAANREDAEKIVFKMEIVSLIKPIEALK